MPDFRGYDLVDPQSQMGGRPLHPEGWQRSAALQFGHIEHLNNLTL